MRGLWSYKSRVSGCQRLSLFISRLFLCKWDPFAIFWYLAFLQIRLFQGNSVFMSDLLKGFCSASESLHLCSNGLFILLIENLCKVVLLIIIHWHHFDLIIFFTDVTLLRFLIAILNNNSKVLPKGLLPIKSLNNGIIKETSFLLLFFPLLLYILVNFLKLFDIFICDIVVRKCYYLEEQMQVLQGDFGFDLTQIKILECFNSILKGTHRFSFSIHLVLFNSKHLVCRDIG